MLEIIQNSIFYKIKAILLLNYSTARDKFWSWKDVPEKLRSSQLIMSLDTCLA